MEVDDEIMSEEEEGGNEEEKKKPIMVMLVGAPGSGKSTFCDRVMWGSFRPWVRVCQDTIGKGKVGTKAQCLMSASAALREGKSVLIDRCNLDLDQRVDFLKLGVSHQVDVHAVVLDFPPRICISRCVNRSGHEGNLQGGKAAAVVNRMLQNLEFPKLLEGFSRITFCRNENDVQAAIHTYGTLSPSDVLLSGCFGERKPNAKVQLGIMKFLKKVDAAGQVGSENSTSGCGSCPLDGVSTLAFPSLGTADFQFNVEKAADIIVEKVEEFVKYLGDARLVLVDISHKSQILSLVKARAAMKKLDSKKFSTFVGDITKLRSEGNLHCNVIANAANWRLATGGGGVNAAIFSAAGPDLDIATKQLAVSLKPGKALTVPLPSTSPLFTKEGVTHVIHVVGPNMNPKRPHCLYNDYDKGCKVLREAYSSLFQNFASILKSQGKLSVASSVKLDNSSHPDEILNSDEKVRREGDDPRAGMNKKFKGNTEEPESSKTNSAERKEQPNMNKEWRSWTQALYKIAMHPEKHNNVIMEVSDEVVVINDVYPKAQKHLLVLARLDGLDRLADVRQEHLPLLRTMHAVGLKWAEKLTTENDSLIFRLGYHSEPSMRQLHLHVISQDFDSKNVKNKKHWNSFNSPFFRDSVDVIEEVSQNGKATLNDDDKFISMELRCNRCKSAHPNLPRLKSHLSNCRLPFPATLLQNGRLVCAPTKDNAC